MFDKIKIFLEHDESFLDWEQFQRLVHRIINEKPKHILLPELITDCYDADRHQAATVSTSLLLAYASIIALGDVLDGHARYTTPNLTSAALANISAGLSALAFLVLAGFSGNAATLAEGPTVLSDLIFKVAHGQALDA